MFVMTADIKIGPFKPVKPHAFTWRRSIDDFSDTATIKLPAIARLKKNGDQYEVVQTGLQIKEGMQVQGYAGYNGVNPLRFQGFVRRVNFSIPLVIECEGYSYQLRKKEGYTKSYTNTTVKQVLRDLCEGTDIVLSNDIPDVPLKNIYFKNVRGIDVLEYLKDKCLLTVYFNYNVLYAGLRMAEVKQTIKHRLNWNVIQDDQLKFESNRELAQVTIQVEKRKQDGTKEKALQGPKDGMVKVLKVRHIENEQLLQQIAAEERNRLLLKGYEGSLKTFLFPVAEPGMASNIDDVRYPERSSAYFIEAVQGDFSSSGGRQEIKIGPYLK